MKPPGVILHAALGLSLACASSAALGQLTESWVARYNSPENGFDKATDVVLDPSGNVCVTGVRWTQSTTDFVTIKYDSRGDPLWTSVYSSPRNDYDKDARIAVDSDGDVFVTGWINAYGWDFLTIKYNASGEQMWARIYGGGDNDVPHALATDASGNVYVTGGNCSDSYETLKYAPDGTRLWLALYSGVVATDIAVDASGNAYVTGLAGGSYRTIKYDPDGNVVWARDYAGYGNGAWPNALAIDAAGDVYVTGSIQTASAPYNEDCATVKYNAAGVQQWATTYARAGDDVGNAIALGAAGDAYVTGYTWNGTSYDYATLGYDSSGNEKWTKTYNGPGDGEDRANDVAVDGGGAVYVTGKSWNEGRLDYCTIVYTAQGDSSAAARYRGPGDGDNISRAVAVGAGGAAGEVYVTGQSDGGGTSADYATIKYLAASGACCDGDTCRVLSRGACETAGGIYVGNDIPCGPNLCSVSSGWKVVSFHPYSEGVFAYADGVQGGQQVGYSRSQGAGYWTGNARSWVSLGGANPVFPSRAYGIYGGWQVGEEWVPRTTYRAFLWKGSANSAVDLQPAIATESTAFGVYRDEQSNQEVGQAAIDGAWHASLWSGDAASWVDLNPPDAEWSDADGVYRGRQVGEAMVYGVRRASLWSGSDTSWVDLHPAWAGATASSCHSIYGDQQVGDAWVRMPGDSAEKECASLWKNTAGSWVNLSPDSATASGAMGVCGGRQAGSAELRGRWHAGLWTGSPQSWQDLHPYLHPAFTSSRAGGIWSDGLCTWVAGWGYNSATRRTEALMWVAGGCAIGSCCLPDGTCADTTETRCGQVGGKWGGPGTTCTALCLGVSPDIDLQTIITLSPDHSAIQLTEGTFTTACALNCWKAVTIRGAPDGRTIIDCRGSAAPIFTFNQVGEGVLEDLTLLPGPGGAISCQFSSLTLNRVTIIDDTTRAGSPQIDCEGGYPLITSCTLVGCSASQSGCISLRDGSHLTMDHTIIARGTQGQAVWCDDGSSALLSCCDLHGNAGGDWIGCVAGQDGVRHNFSLDPLFCGAPDQDLHLRADSPCAAHPGCGLVGSLGIGCDPANVPGTAALPSAFCLGTARPNPFGSKTTIPYELPQASWVKLVIYDVSGRVVRILANEHRPAGRFAAQWDGRGTGGHAMPKGVYFYELRAGTNNAQRRLALLR